LWCLWREINDQNFEDSERTLEELKFFLFSLCLDNCVFSFFGDFFFSFFFVILDGRLSCILLVYLGCAFNDISITYKKIIVVLLVPLIYYL
jgi:hypothetical protein